MTTPSPRLHGDAGRPANAPAGGLGQENDDAPPANAAGARTGEEAKPLPQATLHEMIDVCHDEALRIETMQEILVRGGSRQRPDPQMVRKMEILQATVRFLEACDQHKRAVRAALDGPVENRR